MPDYQVKIEAVRIGDEVLRIRSLLDRQQFSDPEGVAEKAGISSATWPLFGVVWPAGQVLAELLSRYPAEGKTILEVGCGIALASLTLHRRGLNVTASDYHPLAEPFLLENLKLNTLPPLAYRAGDWSNGHCDLLGKFDLIVGSDVLYEPDHPGLLAGFIDRHSSDRVEVMIVDPGRGYHGRFDREMGSRGYLRVLEDMDVPAFKKKGHVLKYHREQHKVS